MHFIKPTLVFITLVLLACNPITAQSFTKSSIKLSMGIGASMGDVQDGGGLVYCVGYQREIWKDRLRLNPNFSIGHYSTKMTQDISDQYYNSISLETNLFYDIVRIKPFSLVVGCGAFINNTRGLKGTGGDPDVYSGPQSSSYINELYVGGYLGGGFRINPANSRTSINVMPINVHIGNNSFVEAHAKIEVDIKF